MFNTIFVWSIWDGEDKEDSTSVAKYWREEFLPFVPTTDIQFIDESSYAFNVTSVYWDLSAKEFRCEVADKFGASTWANGAGYGVTRQNLENDGWRFDSHEPIY